MQVSCQLSPVVGLVIKVAADYYPPYLNITTKSLIVSEF